MVEAAKAAVQAARQAMQAGETADAEEHFGTAVQAARDEPGLRCDIHLAAADAFFRVPELQRKAVGQYDAALQVAVEMGDTGKEGMICMGKGFALLNGGRVGDLDAAIEAMKRSKQLAEEGGASCLTRRARRAPKSAAHPQKRKPPPPKPRPPLLENPRCVARFIAPLLRV